MTPQSVLGLLAIFIASIGYFAYFKDIFAKKTKPHIFTWLIWSLLTGTAAIGMIADNAGPGAWPMIYVALMCFLIFLLSLKYGERDIKVLDWICLTGGIIAFLFLILSKTPVISLILVCITDGLALVPTIRKSYSKPHEETAESYFASGLQNFITLFAVSSISIITIIYPLFLVFANWSVLVMLLIRRRQLM